MAKIPIANHILTAHALHFHHSQLSLISVNSHLCKVAPKDVRIVRGLLEAYILVYKSPEMDCLTQHWLYIQVGVASSP